MSIPRVAVDMRQFFTQPYASGVQRVLLGLLEAWPHARATPVVLGRHRGEDVVLGSATAIRCLHACFDATESAASQGIPASLASLLEFQLDREPRTALRWPESLVLVDRFLIAEPSLDPQMLRSWRRTSAVMPTTLLFYDALPQTNPEFFLPRQIAAASAYARLAASIPSVVSISAEARSVLLDRLGNRHDGADLVAHPGADHVASGRSQPPQRPVFLAISSVEKRKRFDLLVGAFARVADVVPESRLHIVGRPAGADLIFERLQDEWFHQRVRWFPGLSDLELQAHASQSTALFTIGEEGYGLPAVEMLRRGCPVVFGGTQPAASLFEGAGAVRLPEVTEEAVAAEMVRLSNAEYARALRRSIRPDLLPTWSDFAEVVVDALLSGHPSRS